MSVTFKTTISLLMLGLMLIGSPAKAHALGSGQGCDIDNVNDPAAIVCVIQNIVIVAVAIVGTLFVLMIAYGAYKLSMALGDPKGYSGAIMVWQYALIGFGIVFGVAAILSIIGKAFGITFIDLEGLFNQLTSGINALYILVTQGDGL